MAPYHHGDLPAALLKSAEAVIEREGIAALTMRAIAREAGVSHAAPAHHFGDLSGLLTALAASGFVRFHRHLEAQAATAVSVPHDRLKALGRGYVEFARAHPGLFQVMFRSERLNWTKPALADAGASAFALLTMTEDRPGPQAIVAATARWSFAHGLAMLLIDGRIDAIANTVPGLGPETLIEDLLECLARQTALPTGVAPDR